MSLTSDVILCNRHPLNVPGGQSRLDASWAVVQPEKDQLKGANRNHYRVQRLPPRGPVTSRAYVANGSGASVRWWRMPTFTISPTPTNDEISELPP